ncbi:hypothetical protein [Phytomonospora endophytica]|uniref:Uncharacterized protein n=1 Tax=Phytomonospora endophytica TaxID=714109 RepID=A0A841FNY5_9ACTN|nr:hypothetical protein [Phytomonospora endophytica]MBB6037816.1 hypothetical protein [Phytomonospora endophytica]GIG67655.1 hypothetical protein Pen01_39500 [Phytomonospora endophytica]
MRRFTRLLFSRYGIVGGIVLIIVVVLTVSRLVNGPADSGTAGNNGAADTPSAVHGPDDGVFESSGLPTVGPEPSLDPEADNVLRVAGDFAKKWADPGKDMQDWFDDLAPLSTEELKAQITGVDPISVPTDELIGEPTLVSRRGELAEVTQSAVGGTLRLSLAVTNGRWLVSGVDWERG